MALQDDDRQGLFRHLAGKGSDSIRPRRMPVSVKWVQMFGSFDDLLDSALHIRRPCLRLQQERDDLGVGDQACLVLPRTLKSAP